MKKKKNPIKAIDEAAAQGNEEQVKALAAQIARAAKAKLAKQIKDALIYELIPMRVSEPAIEITNKEAAIKRAGENNG